MESLAL
jgi:hypothetical protein